MTHSSLTDGVKPVRHLSRRAKLFFAILLYLLFCLLGMLFMPPSDNSRKMLAQLVCIILGSGLLTIFLLWVCNWQLWRMKFHIYWYQVDAKVYLTDTEALQAASREMGRYMQNNSAMIFNVSRGYDKKLKKPYVELMAQYSEIRSKRYYFVTFK